MNDESIRKEAKQIMDNFMDALKDIDVEEEFILEEKTASEMKEMAKQQIVISNKDSYQMPPKQKVMLYLQTKEPGWNKQWEKQE